MRGFPSKNGAGVESYEAYKISIYMVKHQLEVLEQMYKINEYCNMQELELS